MQFCDLIMLVFLKLSIHPVRIHGSLSCDRLSRHSSQKFACESKNIIRCAVFSVVALHFGRLCMGKMIDLGQKQTMTIYFVTDREVNLVGQSRIIGRQI